MVEPTFNAIADNIETITSTGPNKDLAVASNIEVSIDTFKEIWNVILEDIKNGQVNGIEQRNAVETLLRQLQEENSEKEE